MGLAPELLHKIKVSFSSGFDIWFFFFYFYWEIVSDFIFCQGAIECPNPDKDIRRFDANMRLFPPFIDNDLCPLTINNTLLQSCYLRNTEWACGVAVYTGKFYDLGTAIAHPTLYNSVLFLFLNHFYALIVFISNKKSITFVSHMKVKYRP